MRYPPWNWTAEHTTAFEGLKRILSTPPTLAYFNPTRQTIIETDSSDFVTAGVLSQYDDNGVLHPVAYFSKKMSSAEYNYCIYEKELLAIIRCFESWRPELTGLSAPVNVYTDHKTLQHFMKTKKLTARQARWAQFLAQFNFIIRYRAGKMNSKADALTRRSQDTRSPPSDRHQSIIPPQAIPTDASIAFNACYVARYSYIQNSNDLLISELSLWISQQIDNTTEPEPEDSDQEPTTPAYNLPDQTRLLAAYEMDPILLEARSAVKRGVRRIPNHVYKVLRADASELTEHDGLLYMQGRIVIPEVDDIKLDILDYYHQSRYFGHPGQKALFAVVSRVFYWGTLRRDCAKYVKGCFTCARTKSSNHAPEGLLKPLQVPDKPWAHITMDLIESLPPCTRNKQVFRHILVVVDRLTKDRIFEPLTSKSANEVTKVLHDRVWCKIGFPETVIFDRGTSWANQIVNEYCSNFNIKWKLSTAHHPETDGQTEIINKGIKDYLKAYVNYAQDNWVDYIFDAEFASRITPCETTGCSPFYAVHGFHPATPQEVLIPHFPNDETTISPDRHERIMTWIKDNSLWAKDRQREYANAHRRPHPTYKLGDKVFVDASHLRHDRQNKKLDLRRIGPYEVIRIIDGKAYEINLPLDLIQAGVTPVFHPSRLSLANDGLPGQHQQGQPPIMIEDYTGVHPEWEVDEIVDCKVTPKGGTQYKATFKGNWPDWNATPPWQPWTDFVNCPDKIVQFHREHPNKPPPPSHFS